jgi:hypothetical protein
MLDTSNSTVLVPSSQDDAVATIGRQDRTHLRITSVNALHMYAVVAIYVREVPHSSCYLRADDAEGFVVQHAVRHPTEAPFLDVQATVRRLLSPKRFKALVGIQRSKGPIDVLSCGVAIGGCTFSMREFEDGEFVAVFEDGDRQTRSRASAADWNALVDAWEAANANYGDAARVDIAESYFRSRGWMPQGVHIFGNATGAN